MLSKTCPELEGGNRWNSAGPLPQLRGNAHRTSMTCLHAGKHKNVRATPIMNGIQMDRTWESMSHHDTHHQWPLRTPTTGTQPSLSQRFGKQLGGFPGPREIAGPWRSQCDSWMKVDTMHYYVGLPSYIIVRVFMITLSGTYGVAIVNFIQCKTHTYHTNHVGSAPVRRSQALTPSPRLRWNTSGDGSSVVIPFWWGTFCSSFLEHLPSVRRTNTASMRVENEQIESVICSM